MTKITKFLRELITPTSSISSNRFLGIFIFSPVLIFLVFFNYDHEYMYGIIGLITALLITNVVAKFSKNKKNDEKNDIG